MAALAAMSITTAMRAIVIREPGGPEVLEAREVAKPEPAAGQVRVRVRATAINRADLLQRLGRYRAPPDSPPDIPGLEIAGEVDALGEHVGGLALGDRVFGLVGGGGYAEHVVTHVRAVARIAGPMAFTDAAAVPEAFVTAWDAMIDQARLSAGETVLVHAIGSGVGTAAMQIASAVGARVIGTSRTPGKLERARAFGLSDTIEVRSGTFTREVLALTDGAGVDVVLELVGGASYLAQDLECLKTCGRIVVVGIPAGARADLDLEMLMKKRGEVRGTTLRARPLEEKILLARLLEQRIAPLLQRGVLRPVVDRVLSLTQAAEAHRAMQNNEPFGKIVLEV
jgi:putative PIG3 family NAD(P)H quinone oxidoreductase